MLRAQKGLVQRVYLSVYAAAGTAGSGLLALPTVSVASARSGTEIVTDASTVSAGAGVYYYDLLPSNSTASIDTLTLTWEYEYESADQVVTDTVDVVAQRLAGLRWIDDSLNRGGTSDDYQHRRKELALQAAEQALEEECDRSFTTRYGTATLDGRGSLFCTLPDYPVQSLISVTADSSSVTVGTLKLYPDTGRVYRAGGWAAGYRNIVAKYEHGEVSVPADVQRAVALVASSLLADGPWDDRGFGVTSDGGFVRLLTAGVGSAAFSIPEVQAVVNRYRRQPAERLLAL